MIENDIENNSCVFYFLIPTPFGISNRDFLCRMKTTERLAKPGAKAIHVKSCEHSGCPPIKKNVRAECVIGGYLFEKDKD